MSLVRFQCPSCHAPLRLENRALFLGRSFDCPDCHADLLIEAAGSESVVARLKPTPITMPAIDRLCRRPTILGWIVAALFVIGLVWSISGEQHRTRTFDDPVPDNLTNDERADSQSHQPRSVSRKEQAVGPTNEPVKTSQVLDQPQPTDSEIVVNAAELPASKEPAPPAPQCRPELPPPPADELPARTLAEMIESRLAQKIARFEQLKPVPFVKLLDVLEDLLGVPIVWDLETVDETQLQKPVTLVLQQTTVANVFDALLQQVGLQRRIIDGRIQLEPLPQ